MEQGRVSNIPTSPCEKIFKALNISPAFRAIRRISDRPQSAIPEKNAASPLPAADPAAKGHPKTKQVAPQQPNSVVPIIFESTVHPTPPNEKEKLVVNVTGKPKGEMPTPRSKVIVGQSHGQGAKATLEVETKAPHISYQVKPVHKVETVSPAKPLVEQGQQKDVTRDKSREQGNKTVPNSSESYTDFINRTLLKIRSTSDVGKNRSGPDGAKIKTKPSSNVVGGKSISFKK